MLYILDEPVIKTSHKSVKLIGNDHQNEEFETACINISGKKPTLKFFHGICNHNDMQSQSVIYIYNPEFFT